MKIENLEQAIRLKERRDVLLKVKGIIEKYTNTALFKVCSGYNETEKQAISDMALTGLVHKYCEDTIKQIDELIERL